LYRSDTGKRKKFNPPKLIIMAILKTITELTLTPLLFIIVGTAKIVKHQRQKDSNALDLDKIILNN